MRTRTDPEISIVIVPKFDFRQNFETDLILKEQCIDRQLDPLIAFGAFVHVNEKL